MPKGIYKRKIGVFKRPNLSKRMMGEGNPMYGKPSPYKGVSRSQEVKDKIRKGHLGKKFTEEHRKNLSIAKKGKPNLKRRGENHPLWKGGVTPINQRIRESLESVNWRRTVFQRDNFTCQKCGQKGGKLEADHIKPFAFHRHLRFVVSNGRTLCKKCHTKTETYGYKKNIYKGRKALILGITGQDGSYLTEFLQDKGYEVYGVVRPASSFNRSRIEEIFNTQEKREKYLLYGEVADPFSTLSIIKAVQPDEIYQLSAQSNVAISWKVPWSTVQVDGIGMLNVLESVRILDMEKKVKIYNAATSELFSGKEGYKQNENTIKDPISPYGSAKLLSYQLCKNYRDAYGMFVASGILFNHESPRRGENFVTQKIVNNADSGKVKLGNVNAKRDWGFSPEYCEAMWLILQQEKPEDFVIATGETHSVKEFVEYVSQSAGHSIKIIHDNKFDRPNEVSMLCGDTTKAEQKLGWKPIVKAKELADIMYKNKKK